MVDYREDMRFSDEMLKRVAEAYRKVRNTLRYLLSNLYDFDPARDATPEAALEELDRYALHRHRQVVARVLEAYQDYEFHVVYHQLVQYCASDLSSFYLDVLKDRLYCDAPAGPRRRSAQTVLHVVARDLALLLAPVLPFTTDEVWPLVPGHAGLGPHRSLPQGGGGGPGAPGPLAGPPGDASGGHEGPRGIPGHEGDRGQPRGAGRGAGPGRGHRSTARARRREHGVPRQRRQPVHRQRGRPGRRRRPPLGSGREGPGAASASAAGPTRPRSASSPPTPACASGAPRCSRPSDETTPLPRHHGRARRPRPAHEVADRALDRAPRLPAPRGGLLEPQPRPQLRGRLRHPGGGRPALPGGALLGPEPRGPPRHRGLRLPPARRGAPAPDRALPHPRRRDRQPDRPAAPRLRGRFRPRLLEAPPLARLQRGGLRDHGRGGPPDPRHPALAPDRERRRARTSSRPRRRPGGPSRCTRGSSRSRFPRSTSWAAPWGGPLTLHTYGFLLAVAFLAGLFVVSSQAKKAGHGRDPHHRHGGLAAHRRARGGQGPAGGGGLALLPAKPA